MTPRPRNVQLERDLTEHACKGHADPEAFIRHAETRAMRLSGEYVTNPMYVQTGRDRRKDAREEAVDGRNHLVWWIEDNPEHPDRDRALTALRYLALAYAELAPTE